MKRKISFLLVITMILAIFAVPVSASPIHARTNMSSSSEVATSADVNTEAFKLTSGKIVAQFIKTDGIVSRVTVSSASYGNSIGGIKLSVYQWKNDYKTTMSGKPVATEEFIDFPDGADLTINLTDKNIQGDVLVTAEGTKEDVALWASAKVFPCYIDGVEHETLAANFRASVTATKEIDTDSIGKPFADAYEGVNISDAVEYYKSTMNALSRTVNDEAIKVPVLIGDDAAYYASYAVDFGSTPPKGAIIEIYNDVPDVAKVQIIADNPVSGEVLCEFHVEVEGADSFWEEIPAKINTKLTGKHVIYYVVDVKNVRTAGIKFTKETPGDSKDEIRLKEFNATKDFELKSTYSDTWTATDLIGRKLADYEEAGDHNPDKQVGMFYWTWHASKGRQNGWPIGINQKVINTYPGPESDIKNNYNYAGWSNQGMWNESIYGVYSGFDAWVMRKQLELLSAAGVDGLFFDSSNGTDTFTGGYMQLCKTMHEMHNDGIQTPGMAFLLPFWDLAYNYTDITRMWETMYSTGLYSDTWYYWDGKPVVMGHPDRFKLKTGIADIDEQNEEILDFFTFRPSQPSYFTGPTLENHWPWLEVYPQHPFGESEKYGCEAVAVGVAMNAGPNGLDAMNGKDVYGRSYTYKDGYSKLSETSKYYGYNFQEQWERAHELDPEFVYITGWNEWVAGHYSEWGQGTKGAYPDQYNDEYSRDLEPTKGEMKDVHYYLLVDEIRKFKGVRPTPEASDEKTIDVNGDFAQWADVGPEFIGYKGGTEPRDFHLQGDLKPVSNYTGRNDIVLSKVARDSENLYFYVQTAEDMTPYTDPSWMRLLINTDRTYKTGWEGYDFIVNRVSPTESTATLEKWTGKEIEDWTWETAAEVEYTLSGNEMMIKIPRSILGVTGDVVDIEFKWNDNMQKQGDIMDVYTNGDTAPVGRFAYHYITDTAKAKKAVDEPVDPATKFAHYGRKFLIMALDKNYAYAYGEEVKIDDQSDVTAPMIINDKTMVPVRFLSESIGATVDWNDAEKTVTIAYHGKRIRLTLGSNVMRVERETFTLQSPATEVENRIYVPLRDIVEALGLPCHWEEPGVIAVGPTEDYMLFYVNGNLEKIFNKFGLQYN